MWSGNEVSSLCCASIVIVIVVLCAREIVASRYITFAPVLCTQQNKVVLDWYKDIG